VGGGGGTSMVAEVSWPTWREAMQQALYGADGFFRRERPGDHFRTSVHASDQFAGAFVRLAGRCGARIVVDIGAGRAELLLAIARYAPELDLVGVEVAGRPTGLPGSVRWTQQLPTDLTEVLVIANEWLDNVPVDVAEVDADGVPRLVHVDPATGREALGAAVTGPDAEWLDRWWPLSGTGPGTRAEIGRSRDAAWATVVGSVRRGVLAAADYCHLRSARPPAGTLSAYRDGRTVPAVPDGSRDITAHVALDACAAAGEGAGATATVLTSQRHALRMLGVDAALPPRELATADPLAYVAALARAGEAAELLDAAGLGGFGWLVQAVDADVPAELTGSPPP
jgi:SAM-dependent MidA family methyltransferase